MNAEMNIIDKERCKSGLYSVGKVAGNCLKETVSMYTTAIRNMTKIEDNIIYFNCD